MSLQADVAMALRALQVGLKRTLVEPVSQEWIVRGTRTKNGFVIRIQFR